VTEQGRPKEGRGKGVPERFENHSLLGQGGENEENWRLEKLEGLFHRRFCEGRALPEEATIEGMGRGAQSVGTRNPLAGALEEKEEKSEQWGKEEAEGIWERIIYYVEGREIFSHL